MNGLAEAYTGGKRPCTSCRRSKVRCDRGSPCGRCRRLGLDCTEQVRTKRGLGKHAKKTALGHEGTAGAGAGSAGRLPFTMSAQRYTMGRSESLGSMQEYGSSPYSVGGDAASFMVCGSSNSSMDGCSGVNPLTTGGGIGGACGFDNACAPSPVQALVDSLLKLNAHGGIERQTAQAVMRSLALSCVRYNYSGVAQQLGRMTTGLGGGDWRSVMDKGMEAEGSSMEADIVNIKMEAAQHQAEQQEIEDGSMADVTATQGPPHKDPASVAATGLTTLDPYVTDLFTGASASAVLVVVNGEQKVLVNDLFAKEFATAQDCEALLDREHGLDVLGRVINAADKADLFGAVGSALFASSEPCCDVAHISRVDNRQGESYMTLARLRWVLRGTGSYSALVLSLQRLPPSRYLFPLSSPTSGSCYSAGGSEADADALSTTEEESDEHAHGPSPLTGHLLPPPACGPDAVFHPSLLRHVPVPVGPPPPQGQPQPHPQIQSQGGHVQLGQAPQPLCQPPRVVGAGADESNGRHSPSAFPTWMVDDEEEDLWGGCISGSLKRDLHDFAPPPHDAMYQPHPAPPSGPPPSLEAFAPSHPHPMGQQPLQAMGSCHQVQHQHQEATCPPDMLHFLDNLF